MRLASHFVVARAYQCAALKNHSQVVAQMRRRRHRRRLGAEPPEAAHHSGESQTSLSAGFPDFHSWRNYDARDNPYRAGPASSGNSQPCTGPSSDDDAVLLRREADSGGTDPSGDASWHYNTQTDVLQLSGLLAG